MPKSYFHMTQAVRSQIFILKATGFSLQDIADQIGYHKSTISRELARNSIEGCYCYQQAQAMASGRRSSASQTPNKLTSHLIEQIEDRVKLDWSPEQIAGRFKREGPLSISYQTIYKHIWANRRSGGTLYQHLRHQGKRYKKRSSGNLAGRGLIPKRVDISERPEVVEAKSEVGHWEGDSIVGVGHQGAAVTYADRCSKFVLIKPVQRRTALLTKQATFDLMGDDHLPVSTITYDNGKEFASHQQIAAKLEASCFFARPYHSWERGLNEHTNGLIRQYWPKSTNLKQVTNQQAQAIMDRLNNRPRKSLQFKTPMEIMIAAQQNAEQARRYDPG